MASDQDLGTAGKGFDLFRDPWIGCVGIGGDVREYGIRELLASAHVLTEIVDPSPLVGVAVHRLLEAVLIASLGIDDEGDWLALYESGRFDDRSLELVEECCGGCMDLLDVDRPFYQSCDIDLRGDGERVKSVGYLYPEAATGTAVVHYAHTAEDDHAYCPKCCAKGLVSLPAFATSGGQGIKPSINGVPPTYVQPLGDTVFRTLMLNWPLRDARPTTAFEPDPGPAWIGRGLVAHKEERVDVGFVESLTWQPRRVRLLGPRQPGTCTRCGRPSDQLTTRVVLDQGLSRPRGASPWLDPWAAYVWRTDKMGVTTCRPLRPQAERQMWRDTGALFLSHVPESEAGARGRPTRPAVVNQLATLLDELEAEQPVDSATVRFQAVGLRTDMKAKVFEWRVDRFELPATVLGTEAAVPVTRALRLAEEAANALSTALLRLHAGTERASPAWSDIREAMAATTTRAARQYWDALEPIFREALFDPRIPAAEAEQADWLREWTGAVRRTVEAVLERVLASSDDTAAGLQRQEVARRTLHSLLRKGETA